MKKYALAAILLCALLTLSCNKEPVDPDIGTESGTETDYVSKLFSAEETASVVTDITDTREDVITAEGTVAVSRALEQTIGENLNLITAHFAGVEDTWTIQDMEDAMPEALENITSLGKEALPYLEVYADRMYSFDSDDENAKTLVARAVAYVIDPKQDIPDTVSPDGRYALTAAVIGFHFGPAPGAVVVPVYDMRIIRTDTGEQLMDRGEVADGSYEYTYTWSDDSRYLIEHTRYRDQTGSVSVFDTEAMAYYTEADKVLALIIDEKLDILTSGDTDDASEQAYIDRNPEAFETIVALG